MGLLSKILEAPTVDLVNVDMHYVKRMAHPSEADKEQWETFGNHPGPLEITLETGTNDIDKVTCRHCVKMLRVMLDEMERQYQIARSRL